jgi:hypothetical protein
MELFSHDSNQLANYRLTALTQTPVSQYTNLPPLKKVEKITDFWGSRKDKINRDIIKGGLDYTGSKLIDIKSQRLANLPKQLRGFDNGVFVQRKGNYTSVLQHLISSDISVAYDN